MQDEDLIRLVRAYFQAVDNEALGDVMDTLHPDCRFSVETHGEVFDGHDQIGAVLKRLWDHHSAVSHHDFRFVTATAQGRVAVQFNVTNTLPDGQTVHKSNCNFFTAKDGRFCEISVYMAGDNTLRTT